MHLLYAFLHQGIKPAKSLPLTQPQSPAFALRQRVRLPMPKEEEEEVCLSNVTKTIETFSSLKLDKNILFFK